MRKTDVASARAIPAKIQKKALAKARARRVRVGGLVFEPKSVEGIIPVELPPRIRNAFTENRDLLKRVLDGRPIRYASDVQIPTRPTVYNLWVEGKANLTKKEKKNIIDGLQKVTQSLQSSDDPVSVYTNSTGGFRAGFKIASYDNLDPSFV